MVGGYFGKLPARSDFVIGTCPRGFLKVWERFLIKGLAQSRLDLEDDWKEAYMTMPVWRFLLVPELREQGSGPVANAVAGAFMPSVDGAGREYPLTLVAETGDRRGCPTERWFDTVEAILRSALQADATLSGFQKSVAEMVLPESGGDALERKEARLAAMSETAGDLKSSFWCQAGESEFAFGCDGLPDASEFRWLMLPENHRAAESENQPAGDTHGRYHSEDHRT